MRTLSRRAQVEIDLVRGLAAFAVLLVHWRDVWLSEYHGTGKLVYFAAGFGRPAVMTFFVMSGMLVGGPVLSSFRDGRWSWGPYLRNRAIRLYLVLVPGLLLTASFDRLSTMLTGVDAGRHEWTTFVGNLTFMQGTLVPSFGSDHPLWSIGNEAFYYVLFPMLLLPVWRWVACAVLAAVWFPNPGIPLGFPIWLFGVAVMNLELSRSWRVLGMLVGAVGLAMWRGYSVPIVDFSTGIGAAFLLMEIRTHQGDVPRWFARVAEGLAGCSYTLYVIHMPFLVLSAAPWGGARDVYSLPPYLGLVATVAFAYGLAQVTEARTYEVRRWLGGGRSSREPSPESRPPVVTGRVAPEPASD